MWAGGTCWNPLKILVQPRQLLVFTEVCCIAAFIFCTYHCVSALQVSQIFSKFPLRILALQTQGSQVLHVNGQTVVIHAHSRSQSSQIADAARCIHWHSAPITQRVSRFEGRRQWKAASEWERFEVVSILMCAKPEKLP